MFAVLGEEFLKYMDVFKPLLLVTLTNTSDVQVCIDREMLPHSVYIYVCV